MKQAILCLALVGLLAGTTPSAVQGAEPANVGLYRVFEAVVENGNSYANKFADVELTATFTAPSGATRQFRGFFDGDGKGGGDLAAGTVWKLRFLPDELGTWSYQYSWSDGTAGDKGQFVCVKEGAGKGVLRAYEKNPYWFAYNGTDPVWLKSYYETGHGSIGQDFDWVVKNVYNKFIAHGYNHLQVNWLLSLCCFNQYYLDGPKPDSLDLQIYQEGKPSSTMNLRVWRLMERHLGYLNDHNIGVHMFLGFDGSKNDSAAWKKLSGEEKDFYVRYVVARLAPFANIAGWNYTWEVPGDRENEELGFARLLMKYDIFEHLRTYEDEFPFQNEYHRPEYTFAAVENHGVVTENKRERGKDRQHWKEAWTHHAAVLQGYRGKPVYMSEGNALWRRYWHERTGATQDDLRQAAWACAVGGASFNWNGHLKEYELYADGPTGLPFNKANEFQASEKAIDILTKVMNNEVAFYRMTPQDSLLSEHNDKRVWAMAEQGSQYLVMSCHGEPFSLELSEGKYQNNIWLDTKTGQQRKVDSIPANGKAVKFVPPSRDTDWVLILRTK